MKNQYSLWSLYLNKLFTYSFIAICMCAMQGNLLARAQNTQNISQKNVAAAGIFSDQQHTQYMPLMHKLTGNIHIKQINAEEDAEEARRSARQAEREADAARQAAEDAKRDAYVAPYGDPYYDDPYYYDDGPYFGFGIGGGHHGHHGWHGGGHHGGHGGGGHHK